jgi:ABC-type multidrug transport system ATPase subunit
MAVRTEGLAKRYGHTIALDGLDLQIEPGEVFGYLGRTVPASRRRSRSYSG